MTKIISTVSIGEPTREDYIRLAEQLHLVDFDCPWIILDGEVVQLPSVYPAQAEHDDEADVLVSDSRWETVSENFTGQYGYNGPVMHASETFSWGMAERFAELAEDFDAFVTTVVEVYEENEDGELEPAATPAGWTVLARRRVEGEAA